MTNWLPQNAFLIILYMNMLIQGNFMKDIFPGYDDTETSNVKYYVTNDPVNLDIQWI